MPWYVYMVECSDTRLYTGITTDVARRIGEHNNGKGCRFTRCRYPVRLFFVRRLRTRSHALREEARIKRLSRSEKLRLAAGSLQP